MSLPCIVFRNTATCLSYVIACDTEQLFMWITTVDIVAHA